MSVKHTPGPWKVEFIGGYHDITTAEGVIVARIGHSHHTSRSEQDANALLLGNALDLLEALRATCGYLLNAKIDLETGAPKKMAITTINGGLARAMAAIAKAEGLP